MLEFPFRLAKRFWSWRDRSVHGYNPYHERKSLLWHRKVVIIAAATASIVSRLLDLLLQ